MRLNLSLKSKKLIIEFEIISFIISCIGTLMLYIHLHYYIDRILYYIGISLFKSGLLAGICSFCFGVFFNDMKERLL